jgi:hypothetical protein
MAGPGNTQADARLIRASYFGKGRDVLPGYQTKSWRWNDPQALAYDADRKRMQIGQVQGMADAIEGVGIAGVLPPWVGRAVGITGALLGHAESAHLEDEHNALEDRRKQLKGQSRN